MASSLVRPWVLASALAVSVLAACQEPPPDPVAPPPPPRHAGAGQAAGAAHPGGAPRAAEAAPAAADDAAPASAQPASAAAPTDADRAAAQQLFLGRCAPCHGARGGGDGPVSANLAPRPRSFADAVWQKEVSDEHIEKIILAGGPAVGRSPIMPASPDLNDRPGTIRALRELVRSFAR